MITQGQWCKIPILNVNQENPTAKHQKWILHGSDQVTERTPALSHDLECRSSLANLWLTVFWRQGIYFSWSPKMVHGPFDGHFAGQDTCFACVAPAVGHHVAHLSTKLDFESWRRQNAEYDEKPDSTLQDTSSKAFVQKPCAQRSKLNKEPLRALGVRARGSGPGKVSSPCMHIPFFSYMHEKGRPCLPGWWKVLAFGNFLHWFRGFSFWVKGSNQRQHDSAKLKMIRWQSHVACFCTLVKRSYMPSSQGRAKTGSRWMEKILYWYLGFLLGNSRSFFVLHAKRLDYECWKSRLGALCAMMRGWVGIASFFLRCVS